MQLKYTDTFLIVALAAGYAAASVGLWLWLGFHATAPSLVLLLVLMAGLQLHLFRLRERQDVAQLRQIQALLSLHALIPFRARVPWLTGWAATPEFAVTLYDLVRDRKPETVVELGSGSSSVIVAYALEQNGTGRLICVDQDAAYAADTRAALQRHGVDAWAEVVHAPIVKTEIDGEGWLWYDRESLPKLSGIDLLIVDGPNRELQRMARFPALPVLFDQLSADALVVLDDAGRRDERAVVERWINSLEGLKQEYLNSPKGTALIRRS